MFPSFIGILDIQSWWEVPSIAHFCSLFRAAFNLLDFDIEELEEALLTDGTEECASSLLTELIVRLLCGCLGNNDISAFNYQMFLRRLFRQKCQETGRYNPFNTDIDFQFLPLRTKVEILYALCDFRLDADDVFELFKNLEAESLRVEPLGWDDNSSAYWYFYGTRLYREDYKVKGKGRKRKIKEEEKKRKKPDGTPEENEKNENSERVWQVVCFTESDWIHLTEKFKAATTKPEKDLFGSLSENFLPEIPRLFQEKERLQRKRLLESVPRRTSTRVQSKNKQKETDEQKQLEEVVESVRERVIARPQYKGNLDNTMRESRARRREKIRTQSASSGSPGSPSGSVEKGVRGSKKTSTSPATAPRPSGRQTNNSLACATGQILIPDAEEREYASKRKKMKKEIFELMQEDVQTDMYKVLEQLKSHEDAWPFMDPVEEDYAPNYYSVIRRPMDLQRMEERLDQGYYRNFTMYKNDFNLIVNNCRLYNGQDNEYTEMVDKLEEAFKKLTERFFDRSSSDDEILVEYPLPNPAPRKHHVKLEKPSLEVEESKKRKRAEVKAEDNKDSEDNSSKKSEDNNSKKSDGNSFKKSEGERKHESGKHKVVEPKNKKIKLEYDSVDTNNHLSGGPSPKDIEKAEKKSKKSRLHKKKKTKGLKTSKSRDEKRLSKKIKQKRKHSKHNTDRVKKKKSSRRLSFESKRSRSNSFCSEEFAREEELAPKKRHVSPEIDFYKDKFDKIKERRRGSSKNNADSDSKTDKGKSNLPLPEKDKNLKLKETIEKLKAKSEKSESPPVYEDLFEPKKSSSKKEKKRYDNSDSHKKTEKPKNRQTDEYEFVDDANPDDASGKVDYSTAAPKKVAKKQSNAKNESATEALEQAVKDISKWLDDDPKVQEFSSESTNSPLQTVASEESPSTVASSKPEEDILSSQQEKEKEKVPNAKKDGLKKRHHKDPTKSLSRRKELQRTIERLQPGKSKGNLLSNVQSCPKQEENFTPSVTSKVKEVKSSLIMKTEEGSPKLSLGTVLPTVGFGLGKQHNFTQEPSTPPNAAKVEVVDTGTMTCENEDNVSTEVDVKSDTVVESEEAPTTEVKVEKPSILAKQCQEKATPNLSAWFKAFGAPKSGGTTSTSMSTSTTTTAAKKKFDDIDQEDLIDRKTTSPDNISNIKNEQSVDDSLIVEGGDSPLPSLTSNSRLRRTSTGSSISERSSFSQDLDSPRHQPSHPSPLIQSPASPRTEDHQKQYPLMNVTVRVGFYQDTASVKSSPEKSCSPREAPQSPYPAYSQHVYAASANGSIQQTNQTQLLSIEGPCKSPLPTYGQTQPPPFYDSSKAAQANKSVRQEDYTAFGPDSMYQRPSSPFSGSFSPAQSPYSQHSQHSPYSHVQHSPQTFGQPTAVSNVIQTVQSTENKVVEKSAVFPVKKRTYNEHSEHVTDVNSGIIQNQGTGKVNENVVASAVGAPPAMYFDEENVETSSSCVVMSNNPSVITSANSKNIKKTIQLSYSPKMETEAVPILPNFTPETVERGTLDLCSQYTDIASDYSARKIQPQINDFSLVGLSKSHIETNAASMYQDTNISKHMSGSTLFSEVKNATEIASKDFSMRNKTIDMINMGYSNKFMDTSKINVDMVNMGYLMPDSGNMENKISAHMSKIDSNMDETKSQRSYDLYNMACNIPFTGRSEQINPSVLKVAPSSEYSDKNKKQQAYDKSHSVLQYTNQPMELMNANRSASVRPSYLENINIVKENRSSIVPTYKEWNAETIKKNDPYNLSAYKEMQNKSDPDKISTSQMLVPANAGLVQKTNTDNLLYESPNNINDTDESQRSKSDNIRVPIIRIEISSSIKPQAETQQLTPSEYIRPRNVNVNMPMHQTKTVDSVNYDRNMAVNAANVYKAQSSHPIDASLRNIPNIPQIIEKYVKDDRMLSAFPPSVPSPYHDKNLPIAYHKNMHGGVPSNQIFQPVSMPMAYGRDTTYSPNIQSSVHNLSVDPIPMETEKKNKSRKKKAIPETSSVGSSNQSFHSYGSLKSGLSSTAEQAAIALKSSNILPGSAFNYGPSALSSGLYGDSSRILEEMRTSSSNQYMAANYMAAAAAAHQSDKGAKPAHQANPFQFLGHPQARPAYPLMGMDPSSALYQQYLHRHQEELLRHSTSQMMGIFPPGYPGSLGVRQPYDSISRPSWL